MPTLSDRFHRSISTSRAFDLPVQKMRKGECTVVVSRGRQNRHPGECILYKVQELIALGAVHILHIISLCRETVHAWKRCCSNEFEHALSLHTYSGGRSPSTYKVARVRPKVILLGVRLSYQFLQGHGIHNTLHLYMRWTT